MSFLFAITVEHKNSTNILCDLGYVARPFCAPMTSCKKQRMLALTTLKVTVAS